MDLAGTPAIPGQVAPRVRSEAGTVRLLSAAEASSPAFLQAWQALSAEASEPNPFFEPWFLFPSLEQFGAGKGCAVLTHSIGNQLTGLMPLACSQSYYGHRVPHVAAWLHDNAFCGVPLVRRGAERAFWRDTLAELDHAPGKALFLNLPHLPAAGPVTAALDAVLAEQDRRTVDVLSAERAMLASDLPPSDYFAASMSSKKRKELRRQHKRLAEEGELVFERSEDADTIDAWITDFLALEAAGWKGKAGSALASAAATRAFFADTLRGAAAAGRLERLTLRLDGRPIAMLANFVTAPGVYSFKTTFDEALARFSPGLLLQIENLDLLARSDIAWADSCAVEGHSMIERIWREKRRIVSRNVAIGGPLRRAAFALLAAYETRGRTGS